MDESFVMWLQHAESKYQDVPEVTENAVEGELALDKTCLSKDSSSLVDVVEALSNADSDVAAAEDRLNLFEGKDDFFLQNCIE